MIDADAIERVKRSTDLAAIVRSHGVELRRKGKQLVGRARSTARTNRRRSSSILAEEERRATLRMRIRTCIRR
jgi:hypothetical protein